MQPLIITAALTGNSATKEINPNVPITIEEIAEDACRCYEEGATLIHIHVRDEDGKPSQSPELYRKVIQRIREKGCPAICQPSLAGKTETDWSMADVLKLNPQMVGLGAGSINRLDRLNCFEPKFIRFMAEEITKRNIVPEMEIFDTAMIFNVQRWQEEGVLPQKLKYQLGLNVPGMLPGNVETLVFMKNCMPPDAIWGVAAGGSQHYNLTAMSIAMGGHARGGLEDCLTDPEGKPASNVGQIRWIRQMAEALGRRVATVDEAKELLGIRNTL